MQMAAEAHEAKHLSATAINPNLDSSFDEQSVPGYLNLIHSKTIKRRDRILEGRRALITQKLDGVDIE